jgi:UDP-3-O-[3-hydroxymyristoyl] glucosamine N-acyltransferase
MVDSRFHFSAGPASLNALLGAIGRELLSDERAARLMISGADELELAGPSNIALAARREYREDLRATRAGAVIVDRTLVDDVPATSIAIVADAPHHLFADLLDRLYPSDTRGVVAAFMEPREHPPIIEPDVKLGANVVIGPGVEIGRGTVIGPNTVIGAGVTIGRNCTIASNCSIDCAYIGNHVVLHAGVRIGVEGFGWLDHGRANRKIPQLGRVIIQDRVEIGANSAIDRGALGDTVIGEGTKIDNLVQIAHNCRIGRNCLLAGTVALSGSTTLEDSVMMGGGAASTGHLTIGAGSIMMAWSAATKDVPRGSQMAGYPARDARLWRREIVAARRLARGDANG